ncbi:MAG: RDD family protein [Treponema sp.]|nr:RDD family protein [Treponema sp.]
MSWQGKSRLDTSLEALTPEGVKFTLTPAGLPVRTLAYGIDIITQWVILFIIILTFVFLGFTPDNWIFLLLLFCIDWLYHVICELAFKGQSLGKHLTGIKVIRSDGAPVDPASSFLRNLLRFADTFLFFFPIAFISITASQGFRRLGDWAGGTLVVYSQTLARFPRNTTAFLAKYDPVAPPYPLSNDEKQAILNFARRYPLFGESRANEIAGIYAPYLRSGGGHLSDAAYLLGIARNLSGESLPEAASSPEVLLPKESQL